jgi:excisionase family DNA binding protein
MSDTAQAPLAYSIQSLAEATDLSYETVRQAVLKKELDARFVGRKAVIPRDEALRWLASLPDSKPAS